MVVFFNGEFLEKENVAISPDDRGFLFADGVYDVVRAYRGRLFRWQEHLDRLAHGLKELRIEGVSLGGLEKIAFQLLKENGLEAAEATLYLQITRGATLRSHRFPPQGTIPTVYAEANPFTPPIELRKKGASAIIVPDERWGRCDIKTINLLPNTMANQRAFEAGAFEAIFARDGLLLEGSHSSILFVKDDALLCPPLTNFILPGITRNVVLSLASTESISVHIRPCLENEVAEFQEILMLGTTSEIVPITKVNGISVGTGVPGRIARKLQSAFRRITQELKSRS
jgi:D-alanine transaminase